MRHFRDQITDPELKRQVAGFIGQEAMHGREHRAFNDRLDRARLPDQAVRADHEARPRACAQRIAPAEANLAATAALEHFTATLAELVLSDEATREQFGHPAVRELFEWHALEESEHKAVAFDVYKAVGGSERMRVWTMNFAPLRLRPRHGRPGRRRRCSVDRETYRRGNAAQEPQAVLRGSSVVSRKVWNQLRTTTGPTSIPTTATPRRSSSSGATELFGDVGHAQRASSSAPSRGLSR